MAMSQDEFNRILQGPSTDFIVYELTTNNPLNQNATFNTLADVTLEQGCTTSSTVHDTNNITPQTLIVAGISGTIDVPILANESTKDIAVKINATTPATNVKATAITTVSLTNLLADGVVTLGSKVSFDLHGINKSKPAHITAIVSTYDITPLVKAINNFTGYTNIVAAIGENDGIITLIEATGRDIKIKNFKHSSAIIVTMDVLGNSETNNLIPQHPLTLSTGGIMNCNSVIVSGNIRFTSPAEFSISSSISAVNGSLFNSPANTINTAALNEVPTASSPITNDFIVRANNALASNCPGHRPLLVPRSSSSSSSSSAFPLIFSWRDLPGSTSPTMYALSTSNTNGIEAATHDQFLGNGFAAGSSGLGAEVGIQQAGPAGSRSTGYAAETFTISHVDGTGATITESVAILANQDAKTIAEDLSRISGVSASAFNKITLSNLGVITTFGAGAAVSLRANNGCCDFTIDNMLTGPNPTCDAAATAINSNAGMQSIGVYAVSHNNSLDIYATQGHSLIIDCAAGAGATGTFDVTSAFNGGNVCVISMPLNGYNGGPFCTPYSYTRAGRVDVTLAQGYTISSNLSAANSLLGGSCGGLANTWLKTTNVGLSNSYEGNAVAMQALNITGSDRANIAITQNESAYSIALKINDKAYITNVTATTSTNLQVTNLRIDGTFSCGGNVSFNLAGFNLIPVPIAASVTSNDLTALKTAINNIAGVTNIHAEFDDVLGTAGLILTESTGRDIKITDFYAGGVPYQAPAIMPVAGTGNAVAVAKVATIDVKGNVSTNSTVAGGVSTFNGPTVTLRDGGANDFQDSVVVGGRIEFTSPDAFFISSSISGISNPGSLFNASANMDIMCTIYANSASASTSTSTSTSASASASASTQRFRI